MCFVRLSCVIAKLAKMSSLIIQLGSLFRNRFAAFLLIACTLMPLLVVLRYRSGSHYLPVSVQISGDLTDSDVKSQVLVVSPFGTTRTLKPDPLNSRLFRSADYVSSPVTRIRILGAGQEFFDRASVRVILGSSVGFFSRDLQLSPVSDFSAHGAGSPEGMVEYGGQRLAGSVLTVPSKCINWQGDLLLLVTCLIQSGAASGLLLLLFRLLICCWRRFTENSIDVKAEAAGKWFPGISRLLVGSIAVGLLLILLHQLWSEGLRFVCANDAIEHLTGLICLVGGVVLLRWVAVDACLPGSRSHICCCGVFLLLLVLLRLCGSGAFPWLQTGDYASYWRIGGLMSRGEWGAINDGYLGTEMMAVRAFLYSFPIRLVAGDSTLALVIVNTFCLVGACACLYAAMASWFGRTEAFIAAVLFSLHPDVLFGGHLCRHDNPAMLYLSVLFLLFGRILAAVLKGWSVGLCRPLMICQVIIAGFLIGVLEAQRSYLPFLLASLGVVLGAAGIYSFSTLRIDGLPLRSAFQRPVACFIMFLLISSTAVGVNAMIVGKVRPLLGTTESTKNWRVLASMETRSEQTWLDFVPFCSQYTTQIPESQQGPFFIRKLLYEKIQSGIEFWISLLRKNSVVSATQSAIRLSGGVIANEAFPSRFHVPLVTLKSTWGSGWYCFLLCLGIIRLLLIPVMPTHHFEWYPGVFSCVFLAMLLALAEAGEQYDLFLAFPLAISGARVLGAQPWSLIREARKNTGASIVSVSSACVRYFSTGLSAMLGVFALQLCLGMVVAGNPSLTFAELQVGSGSEGTGRAMERCAASLLPVSPRGMKKGESLTTHYEVSDSVLGSEWIHFFVSADQRRERLWPECDFTNLPLTFSVAVDDQIVCAGSVKDLKRPPFIVSRISRSRENHRIELTVTAESDVSAIQMQTRGHLTIEYVY